MPPARTYVAPGPLAPGTSTLYTYAQSQPPMARVAGPAFQPRTAWRGIGSRGFLSGFPFGGVFVNDDGFWQTPANFQMLPLGFGLWPACDSAAIPGRFWTIGPCAGLGDYQSITPAYQNERLTESAPAAYYFPLEIIEQPQAAPPSGAAQPSAPEKKQNMVIWLTDGRQLEVSDWWVTEGRFFFIPINGKTESVDLDVLDLQKTIETDEQRGRTFILNFTPPDQRPVSPAPPSNEQ